MKTVDMIPFHDLRRQRADAMAAHIMRIIQPYITDYENNAPKKCYQDLFEAFWESGVEFITDMDRATAGLPPRNDQGYTTEELHLMEARRLEALVKPLFPFQPV